MKTIKFRGQTIDNKWVYGDLIQIGGGALIYHGSKQTVEEIPQENSPCAVGFYSHEISPVKLNTIGQFTGVKDKKEIDIYEGDLIKYEIQEPPTEGFPFGGDMIDCIHEVIFNESDCKFELSNKTIPTMNESLCCCRFMEVIGNVFDNEDLVF